MITEGISEDDCKDEFVGEDFGEEVKRDMCLPIVVGRMSDGRMLCADLATLPHLIIAGAVGQGKTLFLNTMIHRFITHYAPEQVKLIVCDPKCVEYTALADSPFLALPMVYETNQFVSAIKWAEKEMERRLKMFARASCRNIQAYNEWVRDECRTPVARVPHVVVIVDEFADYMAEDRKRIEPIVWRLCVQGRASGIHLVIATQQPDRKCITGMIKANMPGRIAFKMAQAADSRHIIGEDGAENLKGLGDLLFLDRDGSSIQRAQCDYVSDAEFLDACEVAVAKYGQGVVQNL